jgi:hypothetical protein
MKPNPITTATSTWSSFCNKTATAVLLVLLTVGTVQAQVTNIIYQDNFSRVGLLNGTVPNMADATGATWIAMNQSNQVMTDGSEVAFTNAIFNAGNVTIFAGPPYNNAFLPLTVEKGHIYTLTASLLASTNYGENWMALGFSTTPTMVAAFSGANVGCGWLLHRSTNVVGSANGANGNFQTFLGPGTATGGTFNFLDTSFTTQFTTYSVVLNTAANPIVWTVTFYTNGTPVTTNTYGSPAPKGNFNVCQGYVGFEANATLGYVQNFSLTDVVPVPAAPSIVEVPQNVTAQQGKTATFWVTAAGPPDPTYQWLSNSVAIRGATNATYTTPAVSIASYNNVQYSVTVSNVAGSQTAGPATLTVVAGQPTVFSATKSASGTSIVVAFSGPVDPVTGLNAANYSLNNGASVVSATSGGANSVILATTLNANLGYYLSVQKVQDLFGDVITTTTNIPVLPAGMVLYLRGDSGVIQDANNLVVEWQDQTTNGNNAVQYFGEKIPNSPIAGPAARPTPTTITPNNMPAINFNNAVTNFLTAAASPSLSINTNLTIVVLANPVAFSPVLDFINKTVGNIPGSFDYQVGASGYAQLQSGVAGAANVDSTAAGLPAIAAGSTYEWVVTRAVTATNYANNSVSNVVTHHLDGLFAGSNIVVITAPGCTDIPNQPVYIGGRQDHYTSAVMNGSIGELMLFNTALSGADLTNIDNYLAVKYFPMTASLPASITTSNGFAVTLAVSTSAFGPAHLGGFQWQMNGTNVAGATNSSFTTPILSSKDNGDTIDVMVTLPNGSPYTSSTSTLTVLTEPPYVFWAGIPIWDTTNQIVVLFDEAVDPVTAATLTNYSLTGASVLSAAIGDVPSKVVLTTSPLTWNGNPGTYSLTVQNVKDLYSNIMATVTLPLGLYPANVMLWLKASTGVVTDAGTNSVNQWNDQSGNANNFYQGAGAGWEPQLVTNAWGDPVIRFTYPSGTAAATNYMAAPVSTLGITGDLSIVAAMNFRAFPAEIISKTGTTSSTKNIPAPFDVYANSAVQILRGNGGTSGNGTSYGSYVATTGVWTNYPCIVAISDAGNTVSHYLSGTSVGTGLLSNGYQEANDFDAGGAVYMGLRADGDYPLNGDVAELIVTASAIPSNEVATLDNYLGAQHQFALFNGTPTKIGMSLTASLTNSQLTLSWPTDHTGWQLQSNSVGLAVTNGWYTVGGSTLTNTITVTPSVAPTNVFYRMFYQQP